MKFNNKPGISIKYGKNNISAVINNGLTVWKSSWFNAKSISLNKPKETYYAEVGDVLFVDKDNNKELYSKNSDFNTLKEEGYRPIAIVGIPGRFNIYGDCSVCCISLNYISEINPAEGTPYEDEPIFFNNVDTSSCNYGSEFNSGNGAYLIDNMTNIIDGFCEQPILPTDYWIGSDDDYVPSEDGIGFYLRKGIGNNAASNRQYSPSPYLKDHTQNPLWWYSTTEQGKTSQSTIDGTAKTDLFISKFWNNDIGKINAIKYIKEYNPYNSNTKGEWYLGSTGEMGMTATRFGVINTIISKLRIVFGNTCAAYFQNKSLMTSAIPDNATDLRLKCIGMKSVVISNVAISATDLLVKPLIKYENTTNKIRINIQWNEYVYSFTLNGRVYYNWDRINYIEMPKYSVLKWSIEINVGYMTDEPLYGEVVINEEMKLGIDSAELIVFDDTLSAGKIILVNRVNKMLYYIHPSKVQDNISSLYYPIGIVTIPQSHNAYDTNEICIVGLRTLSIETPEDGAIYSKETFPFSLTQNKTTTISNKNACINSNPLKNNTESESTNSKEFYIGTTKKGFDIPTYNPKEFCSRSGYTCVTPYANDTLINKPYFNNTSGSYATVVNKIVGQTSTTNFQTKPKEGKGEDYLPTWNVQFYQTPGTSAGDWFISSFGELVYFVSRFDEIKQANDVILQYWPDEFHYNLMEEIQNDILVSIVKRDDNGSSGTTRLYNVNLEDCKSGFESVVEANQRPWLPFTRLDSTKINMI